MTAASEISQPIEWSETTAFAHGHYGNIYINVKGREPLGTVAWGSEYEDICSSIRRGLEGWINPLTGKASVKRVWLKDELYSGQRLDHAPDLIVEWADYRYVGSRVSNYSGPLVDDVHCFYRNVIQSGSHRPEGILLTTGPGIKAGQRIDSVNLQDIAPTILHMSGLPIPSYMDGQVSTHLFDDSWLRDHPQEVVKIELTPRAEQTADALSSKESEEILERLKGLGYME